MSRRLRAWLAVLCLCGAPVAARAEHRVWMFPSPSENGTSLRELFANPDGWRRTRQAIDGVGYADHWLASQFDDAQLRVWLPQLTRWGLKLGLEVGAVKPNSPTGQHAFDVHHRQWDRFIADGARIDHIAMDEPYAATVINLHMPMAYGVEQTAQFIALVRRAYPWMRIGENEPYPHFSPAELMGWFDALQARLRRMGVRGLDFVRLDVDWMHFHPGDALGALGWRGVKMIEDACHQRGLQFSLIYWAANYPSLHRAGQDNAATWTSAILDEGRRFAAAGGVPDEYFVESWLLSNDEIAPPLTLPDSNPNSMTGSVLALESQLGLLR